MGQDTQQIALRVLSHSHAGIQINIGNYHLVSVGLVLRDDVAIRINNHAACDEFKLSIVPAAACRGDTECYKRRLMSS